MAANTNFAVAVHALSVLAHKGELTKSDAIAASVNTNAVVVRRLLSRLVQAGLVRSVAGKNGGFELAHPAEKIELADVMRAIDEGTVFRVHDNIENPVCFVSCNIKEVLGDVSDRVTRAVEQELGKTTVADVLAQTQRV